MYIVHRIAAAAWESPDTAQVAAVGTAGGWDPADGEGAKRGREGQKEGGADRGREGACMHVCIFRASGHKAVCMHACMLGRLLTTCPIYVLNMPHICPKYAPYMS